MWRACDLAKTGSVVDITAFPVAPEEDAWAAGDALVRYLDAGLPVSRVTISSDGGGCLPRFDGEGRVTGMDVGSPAALAEALAGLLRSGQPLERVLPAFTSSPARVLRLPRKGAVAAGSDADLVVLDQEGGVAEVMARGRWHVRGGQVVGQTPLSTGVTLAKSSAAGGRKTASSSLFPSSVERVGPVKT